MSTVFATEEAKAQFLQELHAHCTTRRLTGLKEDEDRVVEWHGENGESAMMMRVIMDARSFTIDDDRVVLDFNEPAAVPRQLIQLRRTIGVDIVKFYEAIPVGRVHLNLAWARWRYSEESLLGLLRVSNLKGSRYVSK